MSIVSILFLANSLQGITGTSDDILKVHKRENFFGSDFEFCTLLLLVKLKY